MIRPDRAMVVVEGATVRLWSRRSTMLAAGSVLSIAGLGFFCWLLFTLATYALPTFAGLTVGLAAFHSGAGVIGALFVGLLAGGATLALGQLTVASTRTPHIRFVLGLVYAVPAAIAGYHVVFALARIGVPGSVWQIAFAMIGAVVSGCTAFSRLALFVPSADRQRTRTTYSPHDGRLLDQGH
jgi:hypothetical protein